MKKFSPILLFCLLFCSCQPDFKVWKDVNANRFEFVKNDSVDYKLTPSGVLYREIYIAQHTGATPKPESQVIMNCTGWLVDGTVFESLESQIMTVAELIPGLQEALIYNDENDKHKFCDSGKRRIYIPYELGYGSTGLKGADGNFVIPPYSTLIFDIELLQVLNN